MNDVVLCANDVMLRINGVGLCPMMLHFAQTGSDFIMRLFVIFDKILLMKKAVVLSICQMLSINGKNT